MAIYKEDIVDIDLENGTVHRSYSNKMLGEGDQNGNRYGVRVLRDGQEVSLSGVSVSGFFIRANGTTVTIPPGTVQGSKGWVTLPKACYVTEGNFRLTIKLTKGSVTVTARVIDGTIIDVDKGELVDPGSVIPNVDPENYDAWVALVEAAAAKIDLLTVEETQISGTRYKIEVTLAEGAVTT